MSERNLWELGEAVAQNPSMWSRVKHSAKGTAVRRVVKVSSLPKAIAMGGAFMLKQVPVPVVRNILSAAVDKAYDMGKSYHRKKYQLAKAQSTKDKVKFGWKDLDVQDMDRYRWKIVDSIKNLNKTTQKFCENIGKYSEEAKVCDAFIKLTSEFAYARKRVKKLRDKTLAMRELCNHTLGWLDDIDVQLEEWAQGNRRKLTDLAKAVPIEAHEECDKTVCAFTEQTKLRFKHSKIANGVQLASSVVSGAFDPLEFIIISQPTDHKVRVANPYTKTVY